MQPLAIGSAATGYGIKATVGTIKKFIEYIRI
jgi:hypothetical protein